MPRNPGPRTAFAALPLVAMMLPLVAYGVPPKVVNIEPTNGDLEVDPQTREIRVEFDQPMSHAGHSVCGGGDAFPKLVGRPTWDGDRVFVMRVKLEPGHDYHFGINCRSAQNFRSASGEPVAPYSVHFRTAGGEAGGNAIDADTQRESIRELRSAIDEHYSYRDLRGVDWEREFKRWERKLTQAKSAEQFASFAGQMLAAAEDKHIWLKVGDQTFASFRRPVTPNANVEKLSTWVPRYKQRCANVYSGRFDDGIGYLAITGLPNDPAGALDMALKGIEMYAEAPGLILDLRLNGGGSETIAQQIAGCFVDEPVKYAQHVNRDPRAEGGFSKVYDRVLQPNANGPRYRGKIAVLTGGVVMSSAEAFLLMMKQTPRCKLFGETSQGASGNPKPHELSNGVVVFLPSWQAMTADGAAFEGVGIRPDVEIKATAADFKDRDPVLDAALAWLRE